MNQMSDKSLLSKTEEKKNQTSGQIQISYKYRDIALISQYTIYTK